MAREDRVVEELPAVLAQLQRQVWLAPVALLEWAQELHSAGLCALAAPELAEWRPGGPGVRAVA